MPPDGSVITLCGEKYHYLLNTGELEWKQWFGEHIDVSNGGAYVICSNDAKLRLCNNNADILWETDRTGSINALQIASDGSLITAGDVFGRVYFFAKNGKLIRSDDTRGDVADFDFRSVINEIAMSEKGQYIAVMTKRGLFYYNKNGRRIWAHEGQSEAGKHVAISGNGKEIAAGCDNLVKFINSSGDLVWDYDIENVITSIAISPDGSGIVVGSQDSRVYFFNKTGNLLWTYDAEHWIRDVDISTNGTRIIAGSMDNFIYLFDVDGKLLWKYRTDDWVNDVAISEDGTFAVGATGSNVYAFNTAGELDISPEQTPTAPESPTVTPAPADPQSNITAPIVSATSTKRPEGNVTVTDESDPADPDGFDLFSLFSMSGMMLGGLLISGMVLGSGYYLKQKKHPVIPYMGGAGYEGNGAEIPVDDMPATEDPVENETQNKLVIFEEMVHAGRAGKAIRFLYSEMLVALTEAGPAGNVKTLTPNEIILRYSGQTYESSLRDFLTLYSRLYYGGDKPSADEIESLANAFSATMEELGGGGSEI